MLSRRKLLQGSSALVLAFALSAWTHGISLFNGGKSQVNFNFLQTGGAFPFIDILKTAQWWGYFDNTNAPVTPDLVDGNGFPTTFVHGGYATVTFAPTVTQRPGNYIVMLFGEGTATTTGSGTLTSAAGVWTRFVVNTNSSDGRIVFQIRTRGIGTYISNAAMFHADDETAWLAGQVWGIKFQQRLAQLGFCIYRFLNWTLGNTTNVRYLSDCKPISYIFYSGFEARASIYAGPTTNVGNAYSATLSGFTLVDKAMVTVLFNASATQSGTCTLNMNGTGAKNILNQASGPLSTGSNSYPEGGNFRSMGTVVYDATLDSYILQGGNAATGSIGINAGVPPSLLIQLCARMGAHPHFVMPQFAVDPMTPYVTDLATLCKTTGPSWMIPSFEGCNETFNTFAGFNQTGYANAKAAAYVANNGWVAGANYQQWYGKIISTIGQAVSAVYGGDTTKYRVLCGVQTATGATFPSGTGASNERLSSAQYVLHGPSQVGYTQSAASGWVTHVACAQYFTPSEYGTNQELVDAFALSLGSVTAAPNYLDTVNSGSGQFTLSKVATLYANWKSWAQSFSINKMCGYEGWYSPDYSNAAVTSALTAATKASPCVITLPTTSIQGIATNSNSSTPAAVAGMALTISGVIGMTQLNNPAAEVVTFTNGSANIAGANTLLLNQAVYFTTNNTLPTPFVASQPYYVVSAGNPFQVSATRGGAAITATTAGVGTQSAQEAWFVTSVSGTGVTLDADASAFTTYSSGGTATYVNGPVLLNNLRQASKQVASSPNSPTGLQGYTTTNLNNFVGLTDGGFTSEFPSLFQFSGSISPGTPLEAWDLLQDIYQTPDPPGVPAYVAFNH